MRHASALQLMSDTLQKKGRGSKRGEEGGREGGCVRERYVDRKRKREGERGRVCVCMCVCEREKERKSERERTKEGLCLSEGPCQTCCAARTDSQQYHVTHTRLARDSHI